MCLVLMLCFIYKYLLILWFYYGTFNRCLFLNVFTDEDLEGYDKMVTGKRKTQRVS